MRFVEQEIPGVYVADIEPIIDERGFFARTRCEREFADAGLHQQMVQDSISYNRKKGTLRGLHFHASPFRQIRFVRCISGSAFLAALDLRPGSAKFLKHVTTVLDQVNHRAIYVPPGIALGFQTLQDETIIFYQMTEFYDPQFERGVRWNDPAFGIDWPEDERTILERDDHYPDFDPKMVSRLE